MRIFVTGGSGFIGSAVIPELISNGHRVLALARSDSSAAAVAALGADVLRGDLEDLAALRTGAGETDGVIHLGFIHDFSRFAEVSEIDRRAIETMGDVLAGSQGPLVIASGVLGLPPGKVVTERDVPLVDASALPRLLGAQAAIALASRGVRTSIVRLAPTVHGKGDHGFVPAIVGIARERGVSAYVGEGHNHWPAVHRLDAAALFRLAVESAPAGSILHGIDESGVQIREIAETIGRNLGVPVASIAPEEANAHFGFLGHFIQLDVTASNAITRDLLGWSPTHAKLIDDLEANYFEKASTR